MRISLDYVDFVLIPIDIFSILFLWSVYCFHIYAVVQVTSFLPHKCHSRWFWPYQFNTDSLSYIRNLNFKYSASRKYSHCFTFSTASSQNGILNYFLPSKFYTQHPLTTWLFFFQFMTPHTPLKIYDVSSHSLCSILPRCTIGSYYSLKFCWMWCHKLGTPALGQFYAFLFTSSLKFRQGWIRSAAIFRSLQKCSIIFTSGLDHSRTFTEISWSHTLVVFAVR